MWGRITTRPRSRSSPFGRGGKRWAKNYTRAPSDSIITADGGGSNGPRLRLWKWELQGLANPLEIPISVMRFPPGTSKWNKGEHRLFSFLSQTWRGEPLADYATVVNLIRRTTTRSGLTVKCRLDMRKYPTGRQVTDKEMATIHLVRAPFHGDWNYAIHPNEQN